MPTSTRGSGIWRTKKQRRQKIFGSIADTRRNSQSRRIPTASGGCFALSESSAERLRTVKRNPALDQRMGLVSVAEDGSFILFARTYPMTITAAAFFRQSDWQNSFLPFLVVHRSHRGATAPTHECGFARLDPAYMRWFKMLAL
jgi:hypothetical protein